MATLKKKINFFESEIGEETLQLLIAMTKDNTFNTSASYSANITRYPDNSMPFVDKHMNYLSTHPAIDPRHYIANLRLMTRKK